MAKLPVSSTLLALLVFAIVFLLGNSSAAAKRKPNHKKPVAQVTGKIFDIDVSGIVTGTASNSASPNSPSQLLFTLTNLANVYESSYASLPCPNNPNHSCWGNRAFRTQIPPAACDGTPRRLSVYSADRTVFGFESPIAEKLFVCYRADSPDKIPDRTPVIFIPGIGGSILTERNNDGTETVIYPDKLFSFEGINDPTAGLNRLDLSLNANIVATDALRRIQ